MPICPKCERDVEDGEAHCPHCLTNLLNELTKDDKPDDDNLDVTQVPDEPLCQGDVPEAAGDDTAQPTPEVVGQEPEKTPAVTELEPEEPATGDAEIESEPDEGEELPAQEEPADEPQKVNCVRYGCPSEERTCSICSESPEPRLLLEVQGHMPVIYRARQVKRVAITKDEITIGRLDPNTHVYPDIDLREFFRQKVGIVGRKNAEVIYDRGQYYVVDRGDNRSTAFQKCKDDDWEVLALDERRELRPGNLILIGKAVAFEVLDLENQ